MTWLSREEQARLGKPFRLFLASLMILIGATAAALLVALAYEVSVSRQTAKLLREVAPFEPPGRNVPSPARVQFFERELADFQALAPRLAGAAFRLPARDVPTPDPLALEERLFSMERAFQREASTDQKEFPAAEGLANLAPSTAEPRAVSQLAYQLDLYDALAPVLIGMKKTEVKGLEFLEPEVGPLAGGGSRERELYRIRVQALTTFQDWVSMLDALGASPVLWRVESLELKRPADSSRLEMAVTLEVTRF